MGVKSFLLNRFFDLQSDLTEAYNKLPKPVLKILISSVSKDERLQQADELMKLIISVNAFMNIKLLTGNINESRQLFHKRVTSIGGKGIDSVTTSDIDIKTQDYLLKARHYKHNPESQNQNPNHSEKASACILYFHGGGFSIGSIDTHDEFCQYLCNHTQMNVISVDYPLAPENPAPSAVEACTQSLQWLHESCQQLAIDPTQIYVAGDSSGGNLATVIAQKTKLTPFAPKAQLLLYPNIDHSKVYNSHHEYGNGLLLTLTDKQQFEYNYIHSGNLKPSNPDVSPILGDLEHLAPAYIVTAELDLLVDEGEAYAHKLRSANVTTFSKRIAGLPHGFIHLLNIHPKSKTACVNLAVGFREFVQKL